MKGLGVDSLWETKFDLSSAGGEGDAGEVDAPVAMIAKMFIGGFIHIIKQQLNYKS